MSCAGYLDDISYYASNTQRLCAKLLGRIKQDPRQVRNLSLQSPTKITLARRGPSQGRAWAARESPLVLMGDGRTNNGFLSSILMTLWPKWRPRASSRFSLPSSLPHASYVGLLSRFMECHEVDIGFLSDVYVCEELRRAYRRPVSEHTLAKNQLRVGDLPSGSRRNSIGTQRSHFTSTISLGLCQRHVSFRRHRLNPAQQSG